MGRIRIWSKPMFLTTLTTLALMQAGFLVPGVKLEARVFLSTVGPGLAEGSRKKARPLPQRPTIVELLLPEEAGNGALWW